MGERGTSDGVPWLDGVTHSFIDLAGLRMHVAEAGRGEAVLLLHGIPQHWREWRKVIPGLAEQYRVIAPDLGGAGWTEDPVPGYSRQQLLADVVALLNALQLERVHVIGHDWGALLGFRLCLVHPERVRRFVSLTIPHPYAVVRPGLLPRMRHAWYQLAIVTPVLGARVLGHGRQPLPRYLFRHFASDASCWSADDIEVFLARLRRPEALHAAQAL